MYFNGAQGTTFHTIKSLYKILLHNWKKKITQYKTLETLHDKRLSLIQHTPLGV